LSQPHVYKHDHDHDEELNERECTVLAYLKEMGFVDKVKNMKIMAEVLSQYPPEKPINEQFSAFMFDKV
jgi:hypothetical protein